MFDYIKKIIGSFLIFIIDLFSFKKVKEEFFTKDKKYECFEKLSRNKKIMSYNIHKGYDNFYRFNINNIIDVIEKQNADILCLQEVTNHKIYDYIKQSLGYRYGIYIDNKCILSNYELENIDINYFDTLGFYKNTSFLKTKLNIDNEDYILINTHLSSDITLLKQKHELEELNEYIKKNYINEKIIAIGDFNIDFNFKNTIELDEINCGHSFPSFFPFLTLDRCFYKNINLKKYPIISKESDHYPLLIEITT